MTEMLKDIGSVRLRTVDAVRSETWCCNASCLLSAHAHSDSFSGGGGGGITKCYETWRGTMYTNWNE